MPLRHLARRYQTLDTEIGELDTEIRGLCAKANPALLAAEGVGPDTAAALLVAVGDNPGRMKSERSFAALCGTSPVQASSGQTMRHRLNRGGDRQANCALWRIATTRMRHDARTKDYVTPTPDRRKEPKRDHPLPQEAHHREIYRLITNPPQPRTARSCAPYANKAASPSPKPPTLSEPTLPASQKSNAAETTTTSSLPDTRTGSEPTNPPHHHRFDNHRSINAAVICVARRRPNIILAMLKTQTPYHHPNSNPKPPKKLPPSGLTTRQGHPPYPVKPYIPVHLLRSPRLPLRCKAFGLAPWVLTRTVQGVRAAERLRSRPTASLPTCHRATTYPESTDGEHAADMEIWWKCFASHLPPGNHLHLARQTHICIRRRSRSGQGPYSSVIRPCLRVTPT